MRRLAIDYRSSKKADQIRLAPGSMHVKQMIEKEEHSGSNKNQ